MVGHGRRGASLYYSQRRLVRAVVASGADLNGILHVACCVAEQGRGVRKVAPRVGQHDFVPQLLLSDRNSWKDGGNQQGIVAKQDGLRRITARWSMHESSSSV